MAIPLSAESQKIRDYLQAHPQAKPKEVAAALKVDVQKVNANKQALRKLGGGKAAPQAQAAPKAENGKAAASQEFEAHPMFDRGIIKGRDSAFEDVDTIYRIADSMGADRLLKLVERIAKSQGY